jgi:2',3'-cyclic-nucleotide 2'-phosphodiesterase (5'-nucleotidase family)
LGYGILAAGCFRQEVIMFKSHCHFALVLSAGVALVAAAPEAGATSAGRDLVVLSTASTRGELDHCGCPKAPKGGLTRRATYVDSMRTAAGPLLLVDGGDYCHPTPGHDDRENAFILEAMGKMRYDAMTLGELEIDRGVDYVKSLLTTTPVPITLANVRFAADSTPVGEPYVIREVDGVTYGIIGLLGQDLGEGKAKFDELGFAVEDPLAAAARLVPEVKKDVDLVVVLAHLSATEANALPAAVSGIDLVVCGHYPGTADPAQSGGAIMMRPGQRGQTVGEARITLAADGKIADFSGRAVVLDTRSIREDTELLAELRSLMAALGKQLRDDTVTAAAESGGIYQKIGPEPIVTPP